MRYLWTVIWSFLLSFLISYVLSSMGGAESLPFDQVLVLTVIFSVAIFLLGGALKEETE
ncbi:DUF2929 family protein [Virgibacillus senegalensis]|uniref:DUF2929 family protein n=1 Tax=Virgibacillus senegalensis TaxID=1499679 RepID=UPI000B222EBD|nr:DUF2929 family protein [Virgibacillus senegalensis]